MQKVVLVGLPVEVSGWDCEGRFFVEHSRLDSSESGEKSVLLRSAVSRHGLIFIRADSTNRFVNAHPEAYQVEKTTPAERFGFNRLDVTDFPPFPTGLYEPKVPGKHPINVRDEVKS
jgi:hypothetical protein